MSRLSWTAMAAVLTAGLALVPGCRPERYFGPYRLEVPTEIMERSAARTFELPLDASDKRERDNLVYCLENEPEREIPCRCDFPVLTADEQDVRIDYRLAHTAGAPVNASVWVGREVAADAEPPDLIPDLPRVEVMAIHLHRLQVGERVDDVFSEEELFQADLAFAAEHLDACEPDKPGQAPAPLAWLVGLSLTDDDDGQVWLETTFRVRPGS